MNLKKSLKFYFTHWKIIFQIMAVPFTLFLLFILFKSNVFFAGLFSVFYVFFLLASQIVIFLIILEKNALLNGIINLFSKAIFLILPFVSIIAFFVPFFILIVISFNFFPSEINFLLAIPTVLIAVWLIFSFLVLFADNHRGFSALAAALYYIKNYWLKATGIFFIFTVFNSFALKAISFLFTKQFAVIIGEIFNIFIFIPFLIIYFSLFYKSIKKVKSAAPSKIILSQLRKAAIIFFTVSAAVLILIAGFIGFLFFNFISEFFLQIKNSGSF